MEKIEIRFEPLWAYLYGCGAITILGIHMSFTGNFSLLLFGGIIEIILLFFHVLLRQEIIAVISEEGIDIPYKRKVKWEEIVNWSYVPGGKLLIWNELHIKTENEEYVIKGFKSSKVLKCFNDKIQNRYNNKFFQFAIFIISILLGLFIIFEKDIKRLF